MLLEKWSDCCKAFVQNCRKSAAVCVQRPCQQPTVFHRSSTFYRRYYKVISFFDRTVYKQQANINQQNDIGVSHGVMVSAGAPFTEAPVLRGAGSSPVLVDLPTSAPSNIARKPLKNKQQMTSL